jgi:peptidyl-tRNA hydrolase
MIDILYRDDLNMRKGKLATQISHAFLSVIISMFVEKEGELFLTDKKLSIVEEYLDGLKKGYEKLNLIPVSSEEELLDFIIDESKIIVITDQGRTCFDGKPTKTCCVYSKYTEDANIIDCMGGADKELEVKQAFVVNKNSKASSIELAHAVAISSLSTFLKTCSKENGGLLIKKNSPLHIWITTGFGKIVLKDNLNGIKRILSEIVTSEVSLYHSLAISSGRNPDVLCVGISEVQDIDKLTGSLKLA